MRVTPFRILVLAIAISAMASFGNQANAQRRGGGGGGGGMGGGGMKSFGGNIGGNTGGQSFRSGGNFQGSMGERNNGRFESFGNQGNWSQKNQFGQNFNDRGFDRDRGLANGNFDRDRDFDRHGHGDWDRFYGRGWYFWPQYGWDYDYDDYYSYWGGPYAYYGDYYGNVGPDYYGSNSYAYSIPQDSTLVEGQGEGKAPPAPTAKDLAKFTDDQLRSFISWAANGLSRELARFDTGNTWIGFFKLNDLKNLSPRAPGSAQGTELAGDRARQVIEDTLKRMDDAAKNDQYSAITNLWGFKALHTALKEADRPTEERQADVIKGQSEMLSKSLERLPTGDSWRKYLSLDTLQKVSDRENLKSNNDIRNIADKFDQVAKNSEYSTIAQMPGFRAIHSTLDKAVGGQNSETAGRVASPPQETKRE